MVVQGLNMVVINRSKTNSHRLEATLSLSIEHIECCDSFDLAAQVVQ
ncbi:hypothetical protein SP41_79 [Salmonella phage 41]|nr:hypothetical protein SP41_79 [Salmonella phage 41]